MRFFSKIIRFLRLKVTLRGGTDAEGTIEEITKNVALRGVNIWMLVCSALLASIGLDVNSTAVIIGAMLISPLMSPILGVGLGIAIQDRSLLKSALKNLGLATFLSLLTSFIYFAISPLGEATPEITARTTPTILDVGVAFFGGIAGIVAGSRRDKTNALPGVAIATALMPPVCTAGYGLAKLSSTIFLGAFYLFFINAVFIALATYLISVWLRFPWREFVDKEQRKRVRRYIAVFAILVIIPSGFIFYNVLSKLQFDKNVKSFVNKEVRRDNRRPIQWEVVDATNPKTLKVYTVGQAVSDEEKRNLTGTLKTYNLGDLQLNIIQLNVSPDEFKNLTSDVQTNIADRLDIVQKVSDEQKKTIESLQTQIAELKENTEPNKSFINDAKWLFPELVRIDWKPPTTDAEGNTSNQPKTLLITFKEDVPTATKTRVRTKILRLAQNRLVDESIQVEEQEPPAPPAENNAGQEQGNNNATQPQP